MIEFKVLFQSNTKWFPASAGVCDEYINLTADAKLQLEDWKIQSDPAERDVKDNVKCEIKKKNTSKYTTKNTSKNTT